MTSTEDETEVARERAREQRYRDAIRKKTERPLQPDGPRNGAFVGTGVRPAKPAPLCPTGRPGRAC